MFHLFGNYFKNSVFSFESNIISILLRQAGFDSGGRICRRKEHRMLFMGKNLKITLKELELTKML